MPAKQTKESIEAELNAGERERAINDLRNVAMETLELEKKLQEVEARLGFPALQSSRPLVERMAAVGMRQGGIARVGKYLDAFSRIVSGRAEELPDDVKRDLVASADAERLGGELLDGIVDRHRQRKP